MLAQYKISGYRSLDASTEAEKIICWNRNKSLRKRKTERTYYIKQKLSGTAMLVSGIIAPFILDGDATFSLFAVPLGVFLLCIRQKVMMFRG